MRDAGKQFETFDSRIIRVLAVGDEPFTLGLIRICLPEERYFLQCRLAGEPLPRKKDFDLLLLDLPAPSPGRTVSWKKLREWKPGIPLLVMHALAGPEKKHFEQETAAEKNFCLLDRGIMPEVLEKVILQLLSGIPRPLIEEELPRRLFRPLPEEMSSCRPWCRLDQAMLLSVFSLPAGKKGGDACEAIQLSFGRWLFFMGDLAGHGESAAESMRKVCEMLRETALCGESGCEPHRLLNTLNAFSFRELGGKSMTCVVAVIDFLHCRIRCQSAGHPPLIGYSPARGKFIYPGNREAADDIPVGWLKDHRYRAEMTGELNFPPDTVFFGFTDGLLDRMDIRKQSPSSWIPPALLKTVCNAPGTAAFPFRLHQALDQLGYRTCRDDITIAAFCKNEPSPTELHFLIRPGSGDPGSAAEDFTLDRTGDEKLAFKAWLLVHEFVTNILLHGLKQEQDSGCCTIYLHLRTGPEYLRVEVLDRGCEWDQHLLQQKNFDFFRRRNGRLTSSGRGIALIAQLSSRITSARYANLNDTVFYLPHAASAETPQKCKRNP